MDIVTVLLKEVKNQTAAELASNTRNRHFCRFPSTFAACSSLKAALQITYRMFRYRCRNKGHIAVARLRVVFNSLFDVV